MCIIHEFLTNKNPDSSDVGRTFRFPTHVILFTFTVPMSRNPILYLFCLQDLYHPGVNYILVFPFKSLPSLPSKYVIHKEITHDNRPWETRDPYTSDNIFHRVTSSTSEVFSYETEHTTSRHHQKFVGGRDHRNSPRNYLSLQ